MERYARFYRLWVYITLIIVTLSVGAIAYFFFDRMTILQGERNHLVSALVRSAVEKDYARIAEELFLKLDTIESRQKELQSLMGEDGLVSLSFAPGSLPPAEVKSMDRSPVETAVSEGRTEIHYPIFFDDLYLGALTIDLDQPQNSAYLASHGSHRLLLLVTSGLLLLWAACMMALKKFVFVPVLSVMRTESEAIAIGKVAAQVAHDIRSPLSALDVALAGSAALPEEKRILVRSAIGRIKDIANNLVAQGKSRMYGTSGDGLPERQVHLLTSLIDILVSEKRLQFRSDLNTEILFQPESQSYGLFAEVEAGSLKRVLSNLINNSVESLPRRQGTVEIRLEGRKDEVLISVTDNGKGIAPAVLPFLGQRRMSLGKSSTDSGSGLGLIYATKSIEGMNGRLEIQSEQGRGTSVSIHLPRQPAPHWFVERLEVGSETQVLVADDDNSIHQIWAGRFQSLSKPEDRISVSHFSTPEALLDWYRSESTNSQTNTLYLIDYEFLGSSMNGLELIREMNPVSSAFLVTSRFEEAPLRSECERLQVKVIPKGLAGLVPIVVHSEPKRRRPVAVVIDDDSLIHASWRLQAKSEDKVIECFFSCEDFLDVADELDRSTSIFVDVNLGREERGDLASLAIAELGFKNIYLSTGLPMKDVSQGPHIKGIVGKEPFL